MQANHTCLCPDYIDYITLDHHQKLQSNLNHLRYPVFEILQGYMMTYASHLYSNYLQAGRQGRIPESPFIGFTLHLMHICSPVQVTLSNAHKDNTVHPI